MDVKPIKFSDKKRQELASMAYTDSELGAIELYNGMMAKQHSSEAGQVILDHLVQLGVVLLKFVRWDDTGYIYAKDAKERLHVLVGGWFTDFYLLRGLVRRRRADRRFTWLIHGQASTGTVQVEYWAERNRVEFPKFKQIADDHKAAIDAACKRRIEAKCA